MLISEFLNDCEQNCSEIAQLCIKHMTNKLYKDIEDIDKDELIQVFSNYSNYNKYLNDYAGVIYNKYSSSVDIVYTEICNYLGVDIDNEYTVDHVITKLEKQEPNNILSVADDDLKLQIIENFEEKLNAVLNSSYYNKNVSKFEKRIDKLSKNLDLLKKVLQI